MLILPGQRRPGFFHLSPILAPVIPTALLRPTYPHPYLIEYFSGAIADLSGRVPDIQGRAWSLTSKGGTFTGTAGGGSAQATGGLGGGIAWLDTGTTDIKVMTTLTIAAASIETGVELCSDGVQGINSYYLGYNSGSKQPQLQIKKNGGNLLTPVNISVIPNGTVLTIIGRRVGNVLTLSVSGYDDLVCTDSSSPLTGTKHGLHFDLDGVSQQPLNSCIIQPP